MNRDAGPTLVLTLLGAHADELSDRASMRVERCDLSIGRADQCDWVLHAQGVSRQHALVRHLNGLYFIEDRSTNGMLLNGRPLRGEPAPLNDGDRLQIDTFEIRVAVEGDADDTARVAAPVVDRDTTAAQSTVAPLSFEALREPAPVTPSSLPATAADHGSLDPLAWFQTTMPGLHEGAMAAEVSPHWNHASPIVERFAEPRVDTSAPPPALVLPENWDHTRSQFDASLRTVEAARAMVEAPVAPPAPVALPVPQAAIPPPVAASAPADTPPPSAPVAAPVASTAPPASAATPAPVAPGPVVAGMEPLFLRMLEGVMDVLRARAELKNGFRMPATLIRRSENNPLKFAPTAHEAMSRLLGEPSDAFLSGEAAIVDAMDDIRLHQVALLAGVRAAFDDLIGQFDPAHFDDDGERRGRFSFGAGRGAWERYRAHFDKLAADPEDRFRRLFGDEFARAYEDQLAQHRRDGQRTGDGR